MPAKMWPLPKLRPYPWPVSVAGALIAALGKAIERLQFRFCSRIRARPLNPSQEGFLARVFDREVDFKRVRVVHGPAGLFSLSSRPFALGNTIYLKKRAATQSLLVHECAHVWQYQRAGPGVLASALWAQLTQRDPYDWEALAKKGLDFAQFNPEAQARFIEENAVLALEGESRMLAFQEEGRGSGIKPAGLAAFDD